MRRPGQGGGAGGGHTCFWGTSHQKHLRLDGYCVTDGPWWLLSSSQGQMGRSTCQVQSVPEREKVAFRYCISCPHRKHRRGCGRAQRHFVEKRFDGAAKRLVDFELVRDRHLRNSAVSVTNMVRCSLLRLAGRRGAHCAKVRQQGISCGAISKSVS